MSDKMTTERESKIARGEVKEDDEDYIDMGAAIRELLLRSCGPVGSLCARGLHYSSGKE